MTFTWGDKFKPKYISIVYGSGWDKGDFKLIDARKTPLGWDFNIWRISISYDNYANVKPRQ